MGARDTALKALLAMGTRGAWSDEGIRAEIAKDGLDSRDAALASRLCYCAVEYRLLLDYYLDSLVKKPRDLQPLIREILRLGACQILFFDRVPDSAAVNEAVEQAKKMGNPGAAALVNGVLRNLSRKKESLPLPDSPGLRYSCPEELTALLARAVGEDSLEALLRAQNEVPPIYLQTNTLKISAAELQKKLSEQGVEAEAHPFCPDCLMMASGNPAELPAFREGLFYVQDPASKLAVLAAEIGPGMRVLDCCAAPGGKSMAAAIAMQNQGELWSGDLHENKLRKIRESAERLGVRILHAEARDASAPRPEWEKSFDRVLCDVPCSGLGVIRKKPDIRYKDLTQIAGLPEVQKRILERSASFVKPGGLLLYSTCTLLPEENHGIVEDFLQRHEEFAKREFSLPISADLPGELTLLPHIHGTDGFYFCLLGRKA